MSLIDALAGGVVIGVASGLFLLVSGRVAGISGISGGLFSFHKGDFGWRLSFLSGLITAGFLALIFFPEKLEAEPVVRSSLVTIAAGLLVGIGTRLGNGCTSGHGICGVARGSCRSIANVVTFILAGMATVFVIRQISNFGATL